MTNDKLKFPALYVRLSGNEQETLGSGAPAWMHTAIRKAKDVLRPYKPFVRTALAVAGPAVEILVQLGVIVNAAQEMEACWKDMK